MRILYLILICTAVMACDTQKKKPAEASTISDSTSVSRPSSIVSIYLVTDIMMPDGSMRQVSDLDMTVEIQSQNKIMGFSGCNQFHGSYTYEDGIFATQGVASTRKMCAENMDIENTFLKYMNIPLDVVNTDRGIQLMKEDATALIFKKIDE